MAVGFLIVIVQLVFVIDVTVGTTFNAQLQCLSPFFNVKKKYVWLIDRIQAGEFKILKMFIVLNTASIAEAIEAVN